MSRGRKSKTVEKIISKKFEEFVESIEDPNVRAAIAEDTIITGGCIVSLLTGEDPNDYDLYFRTEATAKKVAQHYVNKWKEKHPEDWDIVVEDGTEVGGQHEEGRIRIVIPSRGVAAVNQENIQTLGDTEEPDFDNGDIEGYEPVFISSNAITMSNQIQMIVRFHGEAEEIHKTYDFVHCTNHWDSKTKKLTLNQKALESILAKELTYVGSKYPVCSIIRLRKFISRGWVINAGQILKMVMQASELDLMDPAVLEDQLVGVDSAYFAELIEAIGLENPDRLNSAYIGGIIDRIFE